MFTITRRHNGQLRSSISERQLLRGQPQLRPLETLPSLRIS